MVKVNADNFVRAETARMFEDAVLRVAGGAINSFGHFRAPAPIDRQDVIRMNRDTLYSSALVDLSADASVTLPAADNRYMTLMVVNEDHHINAVFHDPGTYPLTIDEFDTRFVALIVRTFVDPLSQDDIATVNALQDAVTIEARADGPYEHPDYDETSRKATFDALVALGAGFPDTRRMFGSISDVDPVRHLTGTATGWGGLPENEAFYLIDTEPRSSGAYTLTLKDVPVDGFWSMTIYNRDGFLEANPYDSYSFNGATATAASDGTVTLNLAPEAGDLANHLYVMDGWNYAFRLYRPRPAVLDGSWTLPEIVPVG